MSGAALSLTMPVPGGDGVELDCGGLGYCSAGGTGRVGDQPFPGDFDGDGNGFGSMLGASREGASGRELTLLPHATTSEIGPGDTFIERVKSGGAESEIPGSLAYAFNTVPALASWTDGSTSGTIDYPAGPNPPGSQENPIVVEGNSQGHVVFEMTFWRPQRAAFPGESGEFIDVGRLRYSFGGCPGPKTDQSADAPAGPSRTLSLSVDLTTCLGSFDSGQTVGLELKAQTAGADASSQRLFLQRK
jgi:hypothetical protein